MRQVGSSDIWVSAGLAYRVLGWLVDSGRHDQAAWLAVGGRYGRSNSMASSRTYLILWLPTAKFRKEMRVGQFGRRTSIPDCRLLNSTHHLVEFTQLITTVPSDGPYFSHDLRFVVLGSEDQELAVSIIRVSHLKRRETRGEKGTVNSPPSQVHLEKCCGLHRREDR